MSTNTTDTTSDSQSQPDSTYRRDNWWGDPTIDDAGESGHRPGTENPNDPAEWIAVQALLSVTRPLCGRSLAEGEAIELTDPELWLPQSRAGIEEFGQKPHRHRYNPETGYINWGETTGVSLSSATTEELLEAARLFCAARESPSWEREALLAYIERRKRNPDDEADDQTILTDGIRKVRAGEIDA